MPFRTCPVLLLPLFAIALGGCASLDKDLKRAAAKESEDRLDAANSLAEHVGERDPDYLARRPEIVKALRSLLDDRSALVRQAAIGALGRVEGSSATSAFIDRLRDRDPWVRLAAAKELVHCAPDPVVTEALSATLRQDESVDVREAAAAALGALRAQSAVYDLYLAFSGDREPGVRFHAYHALCAITGKDFGLDAKAWRAFVQSQR